MLLGNGEYYIEPYTINKINLWILEVIIFKPNKTKEWKIMLL